MDRGWRWRTSARIYAQIYGWSGGLGLLAACGPMIELEDDSSTTASTTASDSTSTSASSRTAGPTTAVTTAMTSVGDVTTLGPDPDSSGASMWLDLYFPESCSTIEQDCPRGYKCMPYANDGGSPWNDTRCVPIVEDPNAPDEPCTVVGNGLSGEDDCDGTSMCWNVDPETNMGTCFPFCIGTEEQPTCADPCDSCPQFGDGAITLCFESCDPLLPSCDPGQACLPLQDSFACTPDASPEDAGIASPCEFINVCPPGLVCLGADAVPGCPDGSVGCCAPFCPVGADSCAEILPGSSCVPWYGEDDEGPAEGCVSAPVGVCIVE